MHNKITILGNLGQDVQQKDGQNGKPFWIFSVATTETWMKDNEKKEETTWHNCILFGNYSGLAPYLMKGQQVLIEGKQKHDRYELKSKTGVPVYVDDKIVMQYYSTINVQTIKLCGSKSSTAGQSNEPYKHEPQAQTGQTNTDFVDNNDSEDLPF